MSEGIIAWFNDGYDYGSILSNGNFYIFHSCDVSESVPPPGSRVRFLLKNNKPKKISTI